MPQVKYGPPTLPEHLLGFDKEMISLKRDEPLNESLSQRMRDWPKEPPQEPPRLDIFFGLPLEDMLASLDESLGEIS